MAQCTPKPILAHVCRVIPAIVDRLTGERADFPLLTARATQHALQRFQIASNVVYGNCAWLEVLEDNSLTWAGRWGENYHFWVETQHAELVDLSISVAHRMRTRKKAPLKTLYGPPMLWSHDVPIFYRYYPVGVAVTEPTDPNDLRKLKLVLDEVAQNCAPSLLRSEEELEFPDEPILCPDHQLLDDSKGTFKLYDRALSVLGIPELPTP